MIYTSRTGHTLFQQNKKYTPILEILQGALLFFVDTSTNLCDRIRHHDGTRKLWFFLSM